MDATSKKPQFADNTEAHRYEARLDGQVVGFVEYRDLRDGRRAMMHTEVDPSMEGRGVGSLLAKSALEDVRARGARAIVACPFISAWLRRHHEFDDLVEIRA